jgi:SAM-dependent methyltransferase
VTEAERWLAAMWPVVREALPEPPAAVVDLGCGSRGGFVPMLLDEGYDAIGVDPNAPDEAPYRQAEFERADLPASIDAAVASTSLHHVADPADVVDRIGEVVRPGGVVVVVEWASERFDEQTARWCFERLGSEESWLQRLRDEWRESGLDWQDYFAGWLEREHLHSGETLIRVLDERLERQQLDYRPYFFAGLAGVTEGDEHAAIEGGVIQAGRIDYVGTRPRSAQA